MNRQHRTVQSESLAPMLWCFVPVFAGVGAIALLLYALLQPAERPNVGLAAYQAPPGTRVEPLPFDAAKNPQNPITSSFALAHDSAPEAAEEPLAKPKEQPVKAEARPPPRKPQRSPPRRRYQDPWSDYAQGRGYRQRRDPWSWF